MTSLDVTIEDLRHALQLVKDRVASLESWLGMTRRENTSLRERETSLLKRVTELTRDNADLVGSLVAMNEKLGEVERILDDCHYAADTREHFCHAAGRMVQELEKALDRPWVPGQVAKSRM